LDSSIVSYEREKLNQKKEQSNEERSNRWACRREKTKIPALEKSALMLLSSTPDLMPRIMYNIFRRLLASHYAVVGVSYPDRNILLLFYLLAGESVSMVGFSPGAILESVGRTSWGLSVGKLLVEVTFE
jgi:hypothetical protein